ncbi:ParB/RepB/Spo0J family partition protein [Alicycliphilus denitrificans]|uniref:ParB/RepB/Spo0J family partition protein n=1 Tax=Alicycliphilus denitrificans TaxID=179636 RepID=UPI00384A5D48
MATGSAIDFLSTLGDTEEQRTDIAVTDISPDPAQPRRVFNEDEMAFLERGIKNSGILQPLLLRTAPAGSGTKYILIDGERRWRIAQRANLTTVPALIRDDIPAARLRFIQAMANNNRASLTDYELAIVIKEELDNDSKLKKKDVAELLGLNASQVSRLLALLEPEFAELAQSGKIASADALAKLKALEPESRERLMLEAQTGDFVISRDAVEAESKAVKAQQEAQEPAQEPGNQAGHDTGTATDSSALQGGADGSPSGFDDSDHGGTPPSTAPTVATPRPKEPTSKAPASSSVKLTLAVEDVELLIPYFVAKDQEKVELKMSQDTAMGLIEKLTGGKAPAELADYAQAIKDGIQAQLHTA